MNLSQYLTEGFLSKKTGLYSKNGKIEFEKGMTLDEAVAMLDSAGFTMVGSRDPRRNENEDLLVMMKKPGLNYILYRNSIYPNQIDLDMSFDYGDTMYEISFEGPKEILIYTVRGYGVKPYMYDGEAFVPQDPESFEWFNKFANRMKPTVHEGLVSKKTGMYSKVTIRDLDLNIGYNDFISLISEYCSNEGDYTDKELPFGEKTYTMICDCAKLERRPAFYTCTLSNVTRYVVIGNKYKQTLLIAFAMDKDKMVEANLCVYKKSNSGFVLSARYEDNSLVELPDTIKKMIEGNKV